MRDQTFGPHVRLVASYFWSSIFQVLMFLFCTEDTWFLQIFSCCKVASKATKSTPLTVKMQKIWLYYINPWHNSSERMCLSLSSPASLCRTMCKEKEALPLLQTTDQRAGARVPIQHLHQQGQTHAAVSPPASHRSVCSYFSSIRSQSDKC